MKGIRKVLDLLIVLHLGIVGIYYGYVGPTLFERVTGIAMIQCSLYRLDKMDGTIPR